MEQINLHVCGDDAPLPRERAPRAGAAGRRAASDAVAHGRSYILVLTKTASFAFAFFLRPLLSYCAKGRERGG